MKVLHVFNRHRGGGGSDNAWAETIRLSREAGVDVVTFERDSREISGFRAKVGAFASGIYARRAVQDFGDCLQRERPDVVHTHELYPLISPWVLPVCAEAGIPVVHSCYDFRLTCPIATHARGGAVCTDCIDRSEISALLHNCRGNFAESAAYAIRNGIARGTRLFQRHVSRFVVLTDFSRDWMAANAAIAPERIAVIPPAVDASIDPVDPARGAYVAFAGRPVPEKGAQLLVEALRGSGIPLKLAINQPQFEAIRPGDLVECVPTANREELRAFYRGARMLVVPSLWFETFALVAAEAMAEGIPVVASRIGALQDTVRDDETGLLVAPGDTTGLREAIERLWSDDELARRLGGAAHRRVVSDFSPGQHVARLGQIYKEVLCSPRLAA